MRPPFRGHTFFFVLFRFSMQRNLRDDHQLADDFNETIRGKFRVSRNNIEPQFYNPLFRHNNSAFAGWMFTHISHPIQYFVLVINPIVAEPLYDLRVAPYWLCGWYEFFSSPITERSIFATTNWIWQLLGLGWSIRAFLMNLMVFGVNRD